MGVALDTSDDTNFDDEKVARFDQLMLIIPEIASLMECSMLRGMWSVDLAHSQHRFFDGKFINVIGRTGSGRALPIAPGLLAGETNDSMEFVKRNLDGHDVPIHPPPANDATVTLAEVLSTDKAVFSDRSQVLLTFIDGLTAKSRPDARKVTQADLEAVAAEDVVSEGDEELDDGPRPRVTARKTVAGGHDYYPCFPQDKAITGSGRRTCGPHWNGDVEKNKELKAVGANKLPVVKFYGVCSAKSPQNLVRTLKDTQSSKYKPAGKYMMNPLDKEWCRLQGVPWDPSSYVYHTFLDEHRYAALYGVKSNGDSERENGALGKKNTGLGIRALHPLNFLQQHLNRINRLIQEELDEARKLVSADEVVVKFAKERYQANKTASLKHTLLHSDHAKLTFLVQHRAVQRSAGGGHTASLLHQGIVDLKHKRCFICYMWQEHRIICEHGTAAAVQSSYFETTMKRFEGGIESERAQTWWLECCFERCHVLEDIVHVFSQIEPIVVPATPDLPSPDAGDLDAEEESIIPQCLLDECSGMAESYTKGTLVPPLKVGAGPLAAPLTSCNGDTARSSCRPFNVVQWGNGETLCRPFNAPWHGVALAQPLILSCQLSRVLVLARGAAGAERPWRQEARPPQARAEEQVQDVPDANERRLLARCCAQQLEAAPG